MKKLSIFALGPSPLVGEGASRSEAGEGFSPRALLWREPLIRRFAPPSPTREKGRENWEA
jgi:hypothetical protein